MYTFSFKPPNHSSHFPSLQHKHIITGSTLTSKVGKQVTNYISSPLFSTLQIQFPFQRDQQMQPELHPFLTPFLMELIDLLLKSHPFILAQTPAGILWEPTSQVGQRIRKVNESGKKTSHLHLSFSTLSISSVEDCLLWSIFMVYPFSQRTKSIFVEHPDFFPPVYHLIATAHLYS